MTAQDYMAEQIERIGQSMAHFAAVTDPEKLTWQPSVEGSAATRSILEQIAECVAVNHYFAALLRGDEPPAGGMTLPALTDAQEAERHLSASTAVLAAAVRALDDDGLTRTFQTRRGATLGKNLIMLAYRNMAYHTGQINLIQLLAGDAEFHAPPTWL